MEPQEKQDPLAQRAQQEKQALLGQLVLLEQRVILANLGLLVRLALKDKRDKPVKQVLLVRLANQVQQV